MIYLTLLNSFGVIILSLWAISHIQKSVTTWDRFKKIEESLAKIKQCSCSKK